MTLRKVGSWTYGNAMAKVYRDPEYNEYQVKLSVGGIAQADATYFTDDRDDAMKTANSMARQANTAGAQAAFERTSMINDINQE